MAVTPNDGVTAAAVPASASRSAFAGWKLFGWGALWAIFAQIGAGVLGGFGGVVMKVVGADARWSTGDLLALYAMLGATGATGILLLAALRRAAVDGGRNRRLGLGDGPISRPILVGVICLVMAAYVATLS